MSTPPCHLMPINSRMRKIRKRRPMSASPRPITAAIGAVGQDERRRQAEVLAFVGDAARLGLAPTDVERIETHGAYIILAGNDAFKLKRAVRLPYMDFSTVEKRRIACQNEIARNQPFAPDIYLAAQPVTRAPDGSLAIDGQGETVDWIVHMRRFPQSQLFSSLARDGRLDILQMDALADVIAAYHAAARQDVSAGGDERFAHVISQLTGAFLYSSDILELDAVRRFSSRIVSALNAGAQILRARSLRGSVRLCHGDLHLSNIVRLDGRHVLFDAIEFDDSLATIDVLYDLAFPLMDLWQRGLNRHANRLFSSYAASAIRTDALDGLAVLAMFMAARAAVRAMVALDRANVGATADRATATSEARGYFDLASRLLDSPPPRLIAVGGCSGTGKSTLAAAVAPDIGCAPGALHLRSDVERKRMFGAAPTERLPNLAYTPTASEQVYRRLCQRAEAALKAGQSVVVDAVFLEPHQRRAIEQVARRCAVPFDGVWLEAPQAQLVARVAARTGDASDADEQVILRQLAIRSQVTCWLSVDASPDQDVVASRVSSLL